MLWALWWLSKYNPPVYSHILNVTELADLKIIQEPHFEEIQRPKL